ncbi:lysophospholipid acyltransferase family protein [Neisseria sp. Ec49-e6-T10]|uniref:lysophospholipid acyltransferase family protein n=1 Tax=Neisseria sp. Ec49-e6-T10 TaxID=3140744 RepID=UPI003EBB72C8
MQAPLAQTNIVVRIGRFLHLFGLVLLGFGILNFCFPFINQDKRYDHIKRWSKKVMKSLNFTVIAKGSIPEDYGNLLVMANHVSWLDIFALNSEHAVCFVAKQEIRKWPMLGRMVAQAGTVFINRNDRKDAVRISENVAKRLEEQRAVAVFPESTTTDGFSLLPLKAALFESVLLSKGQIQPLALLYYDELGQRSTLPSYVGETSLFESLFVILKMRNAKVELVFCDRVTPESEDDRFTLCQKTQALLEAEIVKGLAKN